MKITTTVKEAETRPKNAKYPWVGVGVNSGVIVLFIGPKCGTALKQTRDYELGEQSRFWDESSFTPFKGEITIKVD